MSAVSRCETCGAPMYAEQARCGLCAWEALPEAAELPPPLEVEVDELGTVRALLLVDGELPRGLGAERRPRGGRRPRWHR